MFFKDRFSQCFNNNQIIKDICFRESGWESCHPGHSCIGLIREFYLLHFVASGKGTFHSNGKVSNLGAGEGFLICPGEVTEYYADKEEPWEYCWLGVSGSRVMELLSMAGLKDKRTFKFSDISLVRSVEDMHNEVLKSQNPSITGSGYAILILNKLIETTGDNKHKKPEKDYVRSAINFIEYNYHREITIDELAKMISLNRSHFYRVFREEMGISPQEYLINCRMKNAKRLLKDTNLSIFEIASAVGYKDAVNFSKIFKHRFGISPGKYRLLQLR